MSKFKTNAFASVIAILAATAPPPPTCRHPPPPMPAYAAPVDVGGSWYLRGDIGLTNQSVDKLSNSLDSQIEKIDLGFDSSPFVGGGVGFQFNSFLRFDATGEYRGKAASTG
jgi:opacity protein-like surface antigen